MPSQDEVEDLLGDLMGRYKAAKGKRSAQAGIVKQTLGLINSLDPGAYPELFADEGFQNILEAFALRTTVPNQGQLPPGATMPKGPFIEDKKQWTWADIAEQKLASDGSGNPAMPWVDYTPRGLPNGRQYVNWNGLEFVFQEDVKVHVPKCFVDVLEEGYQGMKRAREHADFLFRRSNGVSSADLLDPNTIRIRGMMSGGAIAPFAQQNWEADAYLAKLDATLGGDDGGDDEGGEDAA